MRSSETRTSTPDFQPVFAELVRRLSVHEDAFTVSVKGTDANAAGGRKVEAPSPEDTYLLLGAPTPEYPGGLHFAGIKIGKRYVSYHLMCVHLTPDLLEGMSECLRRRMQGKSCFNFTAVDAGLFDELDAITAEGRQRYAEQGWLAR